MPTVDESISAGTATWESELNKIKRERIETENKLISLRADSAKAEAYYREQAELDLIKKSLEKKSQNIKKQTEIEAKYAEKMDKASAARQAKILKQKEKELKALENAQKSQESWEKTGNILAEAFTKGSSTSLKDAGKAVAGSIKDSFSTSLNNIGGALADAGKNLLTSTLNKGTASVDTAMNTLSGVYSKIESRLQGSDESFEEINDTMRSQLAASPYVKYTDMLSQISNLVDSGVAYNVEQRAFLASISDKIASTFNAFDANLLKIIRIQQEDSTQYRLGMEASLTSFLNSMYQDTSYLSGASDSVTQALTTSIVQLGTEEGAEYEYNIQKWFGSLSALGVDDNTLTGLASAINALATGNIEELQNSQYMNLIATAANKSGLSVGSLLSQGVNSENANDLIKAIVSYWSDIATETNQVVKNQYSKLYGLSMSDMTAIQNLAEDQITTIFEKNLTYEGMGLELQSQLGKVSDRMHISEKINNVYENFMTGIGLNIASNPFMATTWLINDMIKDATGGINIPSIMAMGSGIDLNTDLNSLIQLGMVGGSTLAQIGKVIDGIQGNGGLNLDAWGYEKYNKVGSGLQMPVTGVTKTTSQTSYIGSSSSDDMYNQTLNNAYTDTQNNEVIQSQVSQAESDAEKSKQQMENLDTNVKAILNLLDAVSTGSALRVKVENYGLTSGFGV